ncbi:transglycosylase SLT domain-containing protein [Streptomyces sp. NPDC088801]|uniref:transglycosylase SLT domain-containing protein n=1 Tax=Streptomyces sp. NPDC088801 TaxID=3365903 RepID=UPI00380D4853
MAGDLDIVGTVGVDVVPIAPNFHDRLKAAVLPAADRVGRDAGERIGDLIGRHIATAIPSAITTGGNVAQNASRRAGNDNAGAFGRAFKSRLEVAFRSLPRPDVRLSTTGFDADLARVRARMEALSNKRIGVDIDEATALAQIESIDAELARLGARSPNVQIRADVASARAELAAVHSQLNDLDRDDVRIRVTANTAQAQAALMQLAVALGAVAAIPLVPIAAAGIGAIASAAVAATAGVGAVALVAIPAVKGVTSAITAKSAAEKESATATNNAAAATVRAAQSAMQMASAQAALRNAHRQAAQSIAQAGRQVEDAERAVAQAAQRAMEQRRQAAESVERAERSLADAKRQAQQAEEDLTQARRDAAQQLRDLNDQLLDGMLDQRDATLRVQEAQEELNRVLADPTSSDLQRERAQLGYDEAVRNADEQKQKQAELKKSVDEANKAGIDGNEGVKRALEQQADAQQNVRDQTDALTQAHQDSARAQVEAAQTVSDAQRNLADAVNNAANTQVQAAESIASAERGVEAARLSSIDTTAKAASKADEYRKALAKLTPEQRALFDSIAGPKGLTAAFKEWVRELQPDVLPLFTRAVNGAKASLPGLSPLVRNSADAVGELFDRASADLKSPFWTRFKRGITDSAKPAIVGLGVAIGNVFKGAAGVVDAFLPHMDNISNRMQDVTGDFADWGTSLRGSPRFERFLDYAAEMGPIVAESLGDIGGAFFEVGQALSPLSGPLFKVLGAMASGIATIAENAPWLVQGVWLAVIATKAWTLAMVAFNFVLNANPIVRIAVLIGVLIGAVVLAYNRFGRFRTAVQATWEAIQIAALWAWDNVLRPVFFAIRDVLQVVGSVALWLWKNVIDPVFTAIWLAARVLFAVVVTAVLTPIWLAIQAVGAIAMWLWRESFKPALSNIATIAKWVWDKALQPVFRWIWDGLKWVGEKVSWLYDKTVKPVFDWIADKAKWVYDKGLRPAFNSIRTAIGLVGDSFKSARKTIETAWNAVAGVAAKPINWVINAVYTKGVKAVWDKVADFVGLDPLPNAPKLLEAPQKFARGGRTRGGIPGVDSIPILAMENEFIIRRESAEKIGFDKLAYMNATGELPGVQRFADGGIVGALGSAWDWTRDKVSGAVSKGVDWAKTGADLIANPSKIWAKLMKPILDKVKANLDVGGLGTTLAKFPVKMVAGLKDKIVDAVTSLGSSGGGGGNIGGTIPTGQRAGIIRAAMAAANVPPPGTVDQWLRGMNTLITRESGWNPNARNNWDINAKNGVPSQGLAQTIPPTFNAYVPASLRSRGILDPVANVAASIRYIVARYGNITNVQQANANRPPAGYAMGGRVTPTWYDEGGMIDPGLHLVANGTGKPEPVFTSQQWATLSAAKGSGQPVTVNVEAKTYLDGREIGGFVDQRIDINNGEMATALNNGRVTI